MPPTGPLTRLKPHQPILPPTNESQQTVRRESTDEIHKRTVVECLKLICYIIYFYIVCLNLLHWFKLESVPCLHFVFYLPLFMLGPKKKNILVPVGCQLRSWVGREFILFYFFQRQRMIGRLFSFKNKKIRSSLYRMKRCCTKT